MAYKRAVDYKKQMLEFRKFSKEEQLKKTNLYLNRLQPQYDDVIHKQEDNWATPKEFLKLGYGDCEDYVLIKYYSLIQLGFDERQLYLTVVKEKFRGGVHMVLSYFDVQEQAPLILDNLSFKILRLDKRTDLNAEHFINAGGVYKIDEEFQLVKIAEKSKQFEALQEKVNRGL